MSRDRLLISLCGCLALLSAAGPAAGARALPAGLNIARNRQISFNTSLTDGAGHRWDFQRYLNVYRGTNYVYGGGLYCQVSRHNVDSGGRGWMNAAGDEIEIGPWSRSNLQVYRRCKVYRDRGLARWLDIFVNTAGSRRKASVRIHTNINGNVSRLRTTSGADSFGKKDWAFITEHDGRASLLHVVCGQMSRLRPTVSAGGRAIYVNYSVTVPAHGVAVLCYFESQGRNTDEIRRRLSNFNVSDLLSDLQPAVRRLIVNFPTSGVIDRIDLNRSGAADTVLLKNGDIILGAITNKEFVIEPFYGPLALPAGKVIGFVAEASQADGVRAVLADGQIVTGRLKNAVVELTLPTGGGLQIPLSRIKQCSYRISKEKPEQSPSPGPMILLRSGDCLAFDSADLACSLRTRHGTVELNGPDLLEIRLDHDQHGVHWAEFLNGSKLAGLLAPEKIVLPIKLGRKLNIPREMILAVRFAQDCKKDPSLTSLTLNNEDVLFGRLAAEALAVATDFGTISIRPDNIVRMSFSPEDPGRVAIRMWDGSTHRGRLRDQTVRFAIRPGPTLNLHVGHIVSIERADALPPDDVVKRAEKYVAMLSAASYKDREEAQEALISLGRTIAPLLKKYLNDPDPEIRQRITAILKKLGVKVSDARGADPRPNFGERRVFIKMGG